MTTLTTNQDVIVLLQSLPAVEYPPALLEETRARFVAQVAHILTADPVELRLAVIDAALGMELDLETRNNLIEEKAELLIQIEKE